MQPRATSTAVLVILSCVASVALAEPVRPSSPLDHLQSFKGRVEVRTNGSTVVVTLSERGAADRQRFIVEMAGHDGLPISLRAGSARVLFWRGHLAVIAPGAGKALHLSIPEVDLTARAPGAAPQLALTPDPEALDDLLRANYELTRIDTATAIISRSGPQALVPEGGEGPKGIFAPDIDYDDPGGGGGGSGCGTSCSISCGDGSSCSATCSPPRCARCSCPASCTCSP